MALLLAVGRHPHEIGDRRGGHFARPVHGVDLIGDHRHPRQSGRHLNFVFSLLPFDLVAANNMAAAADIQMSWPVTQPTRQQTVHQIQLASKKRARNRFANETKLHPIFAAR